jgi:hypothetical protein
MRVSAGSRQTFAGFPLVTSQIAAVIMLAEPTAALLMNVPGNTPRRVEPRGRNWLSDRNDNCDHTERNREQSRHATDVPLSRIRLAQREAASVRTGEGTREEHAADGEKHPCEEEQHADERHRLRAYCVERRPMDTSRCLITRSAVGSSRVRGCPETTPADYRAGPGGRTYDGHVVA